MYVIHIVAHTAMKHKATNASIVAPSPPLSISVTSTMVLESPPPSALESAYISEIKTHLL